MEKPDSMLGCLQAVSSKQPCTAGSSVDLRRGHARRGHWRDSSTPWKPLGPSRRWGGTPPPVCFSLTASSCHSSLGPPRELEPAVPGNPHTERDPYPGLMGWDPLPCGWLAQLHHQHLTRTHKDIFPAFATWHFQKQGRKKKRESEIWRLARVSQKEKRTQGRFRT